MPILRIEQSFFVPDHSRINWDADEEDCTEGIGIPTSFLRRLDRNARFEVVVLNRGVRYIACKRIILDHHAEWNTFKTAPQNAQRKFMIIPISKLQEVGITKARMRKIQSDKNERLIREKEARRNERMKSRQLALI